MKQKQKKVDSNFNKSNELNSIIAHFNTNR